MVADLAAALENESGVTNEKAPSLQSAAAGAAHTAALHRLPALVAQVLQKIFDEGLHKKFTSLSKLRLAPSCQDILQHSKFPERFHINLPVRQSQ